MIYKKLPFFFIILFLSKTASAEWYAGGLYTYTFIDPGGDEFNPTALILKSGYNLGKYLALEVRVGTGIEKGTRDSATFRRAVEIDSIYGAYLKLQGGSKNFNPYIVVGHTESDLSLSIDSTTGDSDNGGFSYGLGIEGPLSNELFFNLELMRYYDENNITVDGVGIGITAWF